MSFLTVDLLIKLVASFVCSVAFAIIFKIAPKHLLYAGVCGLATYFVYYTFEFFGFTLFVAALASTMVTALSAELLSRLRRAPTIVFLIPGVIPTVPGGSLYNAIRYLLLEDLSLAYKYLFDTLQVGLGIAGGIVTVSILVASILERVANHKAQK